MGQPNLNYRFHNPNTLEVCGEYLMRIFIESSAGKVERAVCEAAGNAPEALANIVASCYDR